MMLFEAVSPDSVSVDRLEKGQVEQHLLTIISPIDDSVCVARTAAGHAFALFCTAV